MFIHSLNDAASVTRIPFNFNQPSNKASTGICTTYIRCLTPKNHLVSVNTYSYNESGQADIGDANLNNSPIMVESKTVKLPFGVDPELVSISPDGKRIAWKWFHHDYGSSLSWLGRPIPFLPKNPPIARMEIWTCNTDGSGMQEAGYIDKTYPGFPPYPLFWSNNSKGLFFGDGLGALWVVHP